MSLQTKAKPSQVRGGGGINQIRELPASDLVSTALLFLSERIRVWARVVKMLKELQVLILKQLSQHTLTLHK